MKALQKKLEKRKTQSSNASAEIKRLTDSLKSSEANSNLRVSTLEAKVAELKKQNQKDTNLIEKINEER